MFGLGEIAELATGLVDRFFPPDATPEQKQAAAAALTKEISARDEAKSAIIVAEMQQGDNYTKRARPTVVYAGLVMIGINHVVFPIAARVIALLGDAALISDITPLLQPIELPTAFWAGWSGIVSTWVLGRSIEKGKSGGRLGQIASLITGK